MVRTGYLAECALVDGDTTGYEELEPPGQPLHRLVDLQHGLEVVVPGLVLVDHVHLPLQLLQCPRQVLVVRVCRRRVLEQLRQQQRVLQQPAIIEYI